MSYDLMVFRPEAAPKNETEFLKWFEQQAEWSEDHSYDDPAVTSEELRNWFMEMKESFPALNGPFATDDDDLEKYGDYCIGRDVIYTGFGWSTAEEAYETVTRLAQKYKVGFYDASGSGDILIPNSQGKLESIKSSVKTVKPWWKIW